MKQEKPVADWNLDAALVPFSPANDRDGCFSSLESEKLLECNADAAKAWDTALDGRCSALICDDWEKALEGRTEDDCNGWSSIIEGSVSLSTLTSSLPLSRSMPLMALISDFMSLMLAICITAWVVAEKSGNKGCIVD